MSIIEIDNFESSSSLVTEPFFDQRDRTIDLFGPTVSEEDMPPKWVQMDDIVDITMRLTEMVIVVTSDDVIRAQVKVQPLGKYGTRRQTRPYEWTGPKLYWRLFSSQGLLLLEWDFSEINFSCGTGDYYIRQDNSLNNVYDEVVTVQQARTNYLAVGC